MTLAQIETQLLILGFNKKAYPSNIHIWNDPISTTSVHLYMNSNEHRIFFTSKKRQIRRALTRKTRFVMRTVLGVLRDNI